MSTNELMGIADDVVACIKQVKSCNFECEGGPLRNNIGWNELLLNIEKLLPVKVVRDAISAE